MSKVAFGFCKLLPVSMGDGLLLCPSSNQPTNQPTSDLQEYLSIRVTLPHDRWDDIRRFVLHDVDYCCYKHGGAGRVQEHFHICVPGGVAERLRKRLRDKLGGGNKTYSVKQFTNSLRSFVFYCEHEGSKAIFDGTQIDWQTLIDDVKSQGVYKKRSEIVFDRKDAMGKPKERDWQLGYSNIVAQAVAYRNRNMPGETSLKRVVQHMCAHTRWLPSNSLYKGGMLPYYQLAFEHRIGVRTEFDMSWWDPKAF